MVSVAGALSCSAFPAGRGSYQSSQLRLREVHASQEAVLMRMLRSSESKPSGSPKQGEQLPLENAEFSSCSLSKPGRSLAKWGS